jgi:DNA-binding transcriptional regulator YiaG
MKRGKYNQTEQGRQKQSQGAKKAANVRKERAKSDGAYKAKLLANRNKNSEHPLAVFRLLISLSQEELAGECHVRVASVANWENWRAMPIQSSRDTYERLAKEKKVAAPNWVEIERLYKVKHG